MVYGRVQRLRARGPQPRDRVVARYQQRRPGWMQIARHLTPWALRNIGRFLSQSAAYGAGRYGAKRAFKALAAAPKAKPTGLRVSTTGFSGRGFRKAKRWSKGTNYSVSLCVESGGTLTDADCVYAGHAVAVERALLTLCYAVVHKLFSKLGHRISSMQERINGQSNAAHTAQNWSIQYQYIVDDYTARVSATATIAADASYAGAADTLRASIETIGAGNDATFRIMSCFLRGEDPTTSALEQSFASVALDDSIMKLSFVSAISLQNQTTGTAGVDDQSTDVTNNPIEGRSYSGYGSGLTPKFYNPTLALGQTNNFQPTYQEGLINFDPTGANVTTEMQTILKRPPSASAFSERVKVARVRLQPAQIKKGYVKYTCSMPVHEFFSRISPWLRTHVMATTKFQFGKFEVFALEKMCRTGTGSSNITVGYEINQMYRCSLVQRRCKTMTDHIVP